MDEMPPQPIPAALEPYDERSFISLNSVSRLGLAAEYCREHDPASQHLGSAKRPAQEDEFALTFQRESDIMAQLNAFEQIQAHLAELKTAIASDRALEEWLAPWQDLKWTCH